MTVNDNEQRPEGEAPRATPTDAPAEPTADAPTDAPATRIEVDDREAEAGVVEALRQLPDVEVEIRRLKRGDYAVDGRCLFERKTLPDFAQSIVDGRLFRQARRLAAADCPVALILEGRSSDLQGVHVRREAMQGALISVSLIFGVPVLRAVDAVETAHLLVYASHQMRPLAEGTLKRPGRRPRSKRRLQLHILQGLPGIGPQRATRLLEAFGSVASVVAATEDQLSAVGGLGPATIEKIKAALA